MYGMTRLTATFAARRRLWRLALDVRSVRRRRARRVLGVPTDLGLQCSHRLSQRGHLRLQVGYALLIPFHHKRQRSLRLRRNSVPQLWR